ncbi:MAG: Crp/Fnr family transcriptional regulator [Candidatus Acidiferrales bacterium]
MNLLVAARVLENQAISALGEIPMANSGIAPVSADWRSSFFDGLTLQDRKRILTAARPRRFAANSVITNQGNPADHLFVLTKGRARYFFDEREGRHILLHWLTPGDLIGGKTLLAKPDTYLLSAETVRECSLLVWDRATIRDFAMEHPILLENALATASDYLSWYLAAHVALTCHSAEQRLAGVLENLAGVIGQRVSGGVEIDVTNEELANAANVTHFTASRLMGRWQRLNVMKKSRGKILLRHPARLPSMNSEYVRLSP